MYGIFDFSHDDIAVWGYAEMRLENFVKSTAGNTVNISCPLQTVFYLKMQIDIILGNGDSAVTWRIRIRLFSDFFKTGAEGVKTA